MEFKDTHANVLIVDDNPVNLTSIEAALCEMLPIGEEINLIKALSGEEALTLMFDYDFALILLDVKMPGMNGFEVADFMKKTEKTRNIPIIFVTAINKEEQYIQRGYKSGAVDYLFKPLDPYVLASKVKIFVDLYNQRQTIEKYGEALKSKVDELRKSQEANELKNQFLSNISHEIRTPLNAIIGISKMIMKYKKSNLTEEQTEGIQTIAASGDRLLNLINDILDISKIEAGKMEVFNDSLSIKELIENSAKLITNILEGTPVRFNYKLSDNFPNHIISDEKKINQIITNLLGNAAKFTVEGEISLNIYLEDDNLWFVIKDTGIGISIEDQMSLFQKFNQIDSELSRKYKGTGLGLAISKSMVNLLGGEIFVKSEYGVGSQFYFYIPYKKSYNVLKEKENLENNTREASFLKKILIVDDEEIGRITAKFFLSHRYTLILAESGRSAIEKLKEEKPDIIFMDIMMPEMDGIESLKLIRTIDSNIPVFAMTGMAMNNEKEKIIKEGFDGYISKPINEEELNSILAKYLQEI